MGLTSRESGAHQTTRRSPCKDNSLQVSRIREPLDVQIVPERNATALWECLEQACVILGGVDVVVSDGGPAIHAAVKQLDSQ